MTYNQLTIRSTINGASSPIIAASAVKVLGGSGPTFATNKRLPKDLSQLKTYEREVMKLAREIWNDDPDFARSSVKDDGVVFRDYFGCSSIVVAESWSLLVSTGYLPNKGKLQYLLWALLYCKRYTKRKVMAKVCGINKDVFTTWALSFCNALAMLERHVIVWENRFKGANGADCLISVNTTDMKCKKGPILTSGLRYEFGISIQTGDLVWMNGPFTASRTNNTDATIFQKSLMHHLAQGEKVEAHDGYASASGLIQCPKSNPEQAERMKQRIQNRKRLLDAHFQQWEICDTVFRQESHHHADIVRAIAVMTQLTIENGDKVFECGHQDFTEGTGSTLSL